MCLIQLIPFNVQRSFNDMIKKLFYSYHRKLTISITIKGFLFISAQLDNYALLIKYFFFYKYSIKVQVTKIMIFFLFHYKLSGYVLLVLKVKI